MSLRIDTAALIAGALVIGSTGLGVLGSTVPSSGDNGASYLYNDLALPADADKEVRGEITTWPTAGTLTAYEDGSFTFSGAPDGAYSFSYQLYVDGVATGAPVAASLGVGNLGLLPSLFTNTNIFYAPTVTAGPVDLAPALFTNTNVFYSFNVSVAGSDQALAPSLFTSLNTFYAPTVAPGPVDLAPTLFTNANVFYAPVVALAGNQTLFAPLFTNVNVFYPPMVTDLGLLVPSNLVWVSANRQVAFASAARDVAFISPDRSVTFTSPSRGNT